MSNPSDVSCNVYSGMKVLDRSRAKTSSHPAKTPVSVHFRANYKQRLTESESLRTRSLCSQAYVSPVPVPALYRILLLARASSHHTSTTPSVSCLHEATQSSTTVVPGFRESNRPVLDLDFRVPPLVA